MRVSKHTHTSAAQSEVGFFLFFFFLLLHPLTAAAGHHPSSSSFATSQTGKHSGRAAGQMGNRPPPLLLLHRQFRVRDVPPVRKDLTRPRPTRFFFPSPLLLLVLFSLLRTFHPNTTKRRKSVARAHTLTHTHAHFFPLCSVVEEKFDFFAVENRPFPGPDSRTAVPLVTVHCWLGFREFRCPKTERISISTRRTTKDVRGGPLCSLAALQLLPAAADTANTKPVLPAKRHQCCFSYVVTTVPLLIC